MPSDPSGPFYERLWKVDGINPEGEAKEPEGGSLKRKLLNRMTSIDGCSDTGTPIENEKESLKYKLTTQMTELDTKLTGQMTELDKKLTGQMSELDKKVETWDDKATAAENSAKKAAADAQSAKDSVQPIATRMTTLENSFNTLKNTDFKELKDYIDNEVKKQINSLNNVVIDLSGRVLDLEK
jgi:chromosome segregation ATPase